MSRIGVKSIDVSANVQIDIKDNFIKVSGHLGSLSFCLPVFIGCEYQKEKNKVLLSLVEKKDEYKKFWGLYRSLLNNAVYGVSIGFTAKIKINGIGYKAILDKNFLILSLGFSHQIFIKIPEDLTISIQDTTNFLIKGINKQSVTTMANRIRSLRPPEPYKGKGIIVNDEFVLRKEGKR